MTTPPAPKITYERVLAAVTERCLGIDESPPGEPLQAWMQCPAHAIENPGDRSVQIVSKSGVAKLGCKTGCHHELIFGALGFHPIQPGDEDRARENAILERLCTLEIDAEARRRHAEASAPAIVLPPTRNLTALLAQPDPEIAYRVDRLAPAEARVLLSAQYKAGKSTLRDNLIGSLVDGGRFLGEFTVNTTAAGLVLIDNELSEHTLRRWLRKSQIRNTDAVADVVALRGQVGTFNLLDDRTRTRWARRFADVGADYLMLDCLRPVLDALGLDENRDAGQFLVAFDALLDEAGIRDALVVHHMGHANERARGDSRLQDWPDAIWRLVRADPDDPASPRYFTAYGRDVDVPEGGLDFDEDTRRYTYTEGSRKSAAAAESVATAVHHVVTALVADHLAAGHGIKTRDMLQMLADKGIGNRKAYDALNAGVTRGVIACHDGHRGAKIYRLVNPCKRCGNPVSEADRDVHRECEAE